MARRQRWPSDSGYFLHYPRRISWTSDGATWCRPPPSATILCSCSLLPRNMYRLILREMPRGFRAIIKLNTHWVSVGLEAATWRRDDHGKGEWADQESEGRSSGGRSEYNYIMVSKTDTIHNLQYYYFESCRNELLLLGPWPQCNKFNGTVTSLPSH